MQSNLKAFLKKLPLKIELRIAYHFILLLLSLYFLTEYLYSKFGNKTFFQKLCFLTSLNQLGIVLYYLQAIFYNIRLFIHSYPHSNVKKCPMLLLVYLKTNLSINFLVVFGFWTLKIFFPSALVPRGHELDIQVNWFTDIWLHLFNLFFLLFELIWEQHKKFEFSMEKQIQIFCAVGACYAVILIGHSLFYGREVYPFLRGLGVIAGILIYIVGVGICVIIDFGVTFLIQELWISSH